MKGFDQTLRLFPDDSGLIFRCQLLCLALSGSPVWLASLPLWVKLSLTAVLVGYACAALRERRCGTGAFCPGVVLDGDDRWWLSGGNGGSACPARLVHHISSALLVVLWLEAEHGVRSSLWLRRSKLPPDDWRRLRVRLSLLS